MREAKRTRQAITQHLETPHGAIPARQDNGAPDTAVVAVQRTRDEEPFWLSRVLFWFFLDGLEVVRQRGLFCVVAWLVLLVFGGGLWVQV